MNFGEPSKINRLTKVPEPQQQQPKVIYRARNRTIFVCFG